MFLVFLCGSVCHTVQLRLIRKDWRGSGRCVILRLSQFLRGVTVEICLKPPSVLPMYLPSSEPDTKLHLYRCTSLISVFVSMDVDTFV
jgi:hypothetical protein